MEDDRQQVVQTYLIFLLLLIAFVLPRRLQFSCCAAARLSRPAYQQAGQHGEDLLLCGHLAPLPHLLHPPRHLIRLQRR